MNLPKIIVISEHEDPAEIARKLWEEVIDNRPERRKERNITMTETKRHYLDEVDQAAIRTLVARHGLRPMVDAVGAAALSLHEEGIAVANEYGEPMDHYEIEQAADTLCNGDLY